MTLEDGRTFIPGQGNNAYVFPGVALGVIAGGVRHIPDGLFLLTAEVLLSPLPRIHPRGPVSSTSSYTGSPKIPSLVSSTYLPQSFSGSPERLNVKLLSRSPGGLNFSENTHRLFKAGVAGEGIVSGRGVGRRRWQ